MNLYWCKRRNSKISFHDALYYKFSYCFKNNTKQSIVSSLNFNENKTIERTTYYKKELMIPLSFYKDLFIKIKNYFNKKFNNFEYNIISVDGTYNNTNVNNIKSKLETNLNMGYYNVTKCIPLDITFCGEENKNKEVFQLKKYINEGNFNNIKNVIIVADRAYYSFDLINLLSNNDLNYVIRIRNNSTLKNKKLENVRFITYKDTIDITKKDKNGKNVKLKQTIECNIITNLKNNTHNDEEIKKIYLSRWDIEVFFKLLKSNFKFSKLTEHTLVLITFYKKVINYESLYNKRKKKLLYNIINYIIQY
jgi:hypothetical protein